MTIDSSAKTNEEKLTILSLAPKKSIVPIEKETKFYPVRSEHQDYYKKQSYRYEYYRFRESGLQYSRII